MKDVKSCADIAKLDPKSLVKKLDGMTAQEILAEHDRIMGGRRREQLKQMGQEVAELETKREQSAEAKAQLAKFEVVRSRFYKRPQRYGRPTPVVELTVNNGTESAVSRAYFSGVVGSPGHAGPWIKEDFNYKVAGGAEPGEQAEWSLAPNTFSTWGTVDVPKDAALTATVERLDGADGKALFEIAFGEEEAQRLDELRAKLVELESDGVGSKGG